MALGKRVKCHAVAVQTLQVHDRLDHPLAGEAVQRPEQHHVELATVGVVEQLGELPAAFGTLPAGFMFDILGGNLMPRPGAPFPLTDELVFRILPAVVGAYSGVNRTRILPQNSALIDMTKGSVYPAQNMVSKISIF